MEQESAFNELKHRLTIAPVSHTPILVLMQDYSSLTQMPANPLAMCEVDTRVKQRPTQADINNINLAVNEIVNREQQQHSINPNRNPFEYLWMINCILYAVVVAFLFYKKCKKPAGAKGQKERKTQSQKLKDAYISRATELRRKISIAKAELELKVTKTAMEDIGLIWNEKKCSIEHMKEGVLDSTNHNDRQSITKLKDGETYIFLGILENTQQEDSKVLETTSKTYQQRLSVIWSSPLSDFHKVTATNQYALPALSYPMWTQTWQINALKQIDRESRKIIKDNGGSHPATSTDLYYLLRKMGGRGLKSVETQYKMTKVKTAVNLYTNQDSTMELVRQFDEKCERNGRRSIVKDAKKWYPVTSPPSRLATKERSRHQAKSSRHQPPIKRLVEDSRMFG